MYLCTLSHFRRVVKHIEEKDEDMMLIVIGDHGMTRTGKKKRLKFRSI